jgi:hypothetical protein
MQLYKISICAIVVLNCIRLTLVVLIVDRRPELKKRHLARAPELWTRIRIREYEELQRKIRRLAISSL